ncbi:hypothetical protein AAE478_005124 [Parahypoxylon ruwenzoriense]
MSSEDPNPLAESGVTMHSDSEQYSAGEEISTSPPSSSSPPIVLYKPPTAWSLIRGAAINLLLPFINGMMLGFGELFAHEAAFRSSLSPDGERILSGQASKSATDRGHGRTCEISLAWSDAVSGQAKTPIVTVAGRDDKNTRET